MGAVATFNYETWVQRYPEFSPRVSSGLAAQYFAEATLYHANDGSGPVADQMQQLMLLNMLVAHIAQLNAPAVNGQEASPLVGRISNASEGSVSVQTDYIDPKTDMEAWLQQTKFGAAYLSATTKYRTMHYFPMPGRNFNPYPVG